MSHTLPFYDSDKKASVAKRSIKQWSAERQKRLGTEKAFEILAIAKDLERQGKDIVHLEIGEPDFATPQHIVDAGIQALKDGETHYTPAPGLFQTRNAIAEHITRTRGVQTSAEDIVVTPGAKPIMFYVIMACIDHGDEVIYPNPGYPIYESMISFVGAKPVPLQLKESRDFRFDREDLEKLISPKTKMIIVNSPHNPTGGILTRKELEWIADIAIKNDILVLSDEIYDSIIYDGRHESIYSIPGMKDRTILLAGHSKNYAMTGWRLGYGVLPKLLVPMISQLIINSVACTPPFVQLAGISALDPDKQGPTQHMVSIWKKRRDYMVKELNDMGLRTRPPAGAFYIFSSVEATGWPSAALAEYLLYEGGVAVLDGAFFGEYGTGYIRLSSATSMEIIQEGLKRIRTSLERLRREGMPTKYLKKKKTETEIEWVTYNASGKYRCVVTKQLPGKRWMDMLVNNNFRIDVCQSDIIVPQDEILRVIESGDRCHAVLGQLTEKWDDHMFQRLKQAGGIIYSNYAVGYDNVDVKSATNAKLLVGNTPGVLTNTTAEMAVALTLTAARRVVEGDQFTRQGRFHGWLPTLFVGKLLYGQTLGVVGMGRIGQAYARMMMQGHHMNVLYYDIQPNVDFENYVASYNEFLRKQGRQEVKCQRVSLDELLSNSDVVSLHTPLNKHTRHLINSNKLALMKSDAILVNSSRGPVIDELALVRHCQANPTFYAALDVFENEPKISDGLAQLDNVVIVPHLGSATEWTRAGMASLAAANVLGGVMQWPVWNKKNANGELDVYPFVDGPLQQQPHACPSIVNATQLGYTGMNSRL